MRDFSNVVRNPRARFLVLSLALGFSEDQPPSVRPSPAISVGKLSGASGLREREPGVSETRISCAFCIRTDCE